MPLNWIPMNERTPEDGQECLTKMKHGIISGCYSTQDRTFGGYYWHDLEWSASAWVPIEEAANG